MGGIHSGAAIAATIWFTIFTIGGTMEMSKPPKIRCITVPSLILTYIILLIFIVLVSTSHPSIRNRYRTAWQLTHRYGLFIALVLFWIQTFFTTKTFQYTMAPSEAYIYSPPVWLLTGITVSLIFPWLFLRKVSVRPQALSDQAIRLHFEHTSPIVGTSVRISERPLVDWHRFATITNPIGKGFSLVIHNTNAFTKRTIERAPTSIWVRGIPTCSTLRISTLFKSIVLVAIGSGITPCLAVILAKKTPCRVLWTTESDPEHTYGKADPKAVIHNTRVQGKLDLALETWKMWKESKAEAVCVVGDKGVVGKLVYEMECRGIPAYGGVS
jgi:NAD(P)H-flavin reductase